MDDAPRDHILGDPVGEILVLGLGDEIEERQHGDAGGVRRRGGVGGRNGFVVPRERESRYPLNLHVHFFPYRHSFLNRIRAPEGRFACEVLGGDIYYREDLG